MGRPPSFPPAAGSPPPPLPPPHPSSEEEEGGGGHALPMLPPMVLSVLLLPPPHLLLLALSTWLVGLCASDFIATLPRPLPSSFCVRAGWGARKGGGRRGRGRRRRTRKRPEAGGRHTWALCKQQKLEPNNFMVCRVSCEFCFVKAQRAKLCGNWLIGELVCPTYGGLPPFLLRSRSRSRKKGGIKSADDA